jgi:hypothetical protein
MGRQSVFLIVYNVDDMSDLQRGRGKPWQAKQPGTPTNTETI